MPSSQNNYVSKKDTKISHLISISNDARILPHWDYSSTGSVQVSVFRDRVEVWNPGTLPPELDLEKLTKPHGSFPPNPLLADVLFQTGDIERYGTGTLEVIRLAKENNLNAPLFELDSGFKVTLWRPSAGNQEVTAHDTAHDAAHDTAHDQQFLHLDTHSHRLVYIMDGEMSREQLMDKLELTHRTNFNENYLKPAMADHLIEMTLPDKPTSKKQKYRLTSAGQKLKKQLEQH